ncbi:MAG: outer membrane beta-barrel protein [Fusobacteria bacterium]|nr:outer membrane beta-barrel protein [Fusobacteriota bacterium]
MKKILLVGALTVVGAQFAFCSIVQGGFHTDLSGGINIPVSYSESGFNNGLDMNRNNSVSAGYVLNAALLYGVANNNEMGIGLGVATLNASPTNAYKIFEEAYFSRSSLNSLTSIPIYFEDKYEFQGSSMTPFVLGRIGMNISRFSNADGWFNTSETIDPGLYLGVGAGIYITNNFYAELDANYYQLTDHLSFNNNTSNDTTNIFTTGLQLGYTF